MNVPALDEELAALRGAALVELNQLGEDLGLDLAPPDPAGLSDVALNTAREIDKMRAEVADWALTSGRALARRRARFLVQELAQELLAELDLCAPWGSADDLQLRLGKSPLRPHAGSWRPARAGDAGLRRAGRRRPRLAHPLLPGLLCPADHAGGFPAPGAARPDRGRLGDADRGRARGGLRLNGDAIRPLPNGECDNPWPLPAPPRRSWRAWLARMWAWWASWR